MDPGWLYLLAGLGLLCATVLISAVQDTRQAQFVRDRILAEEGHRLDRIERHQEFISALDRKEPALIESLAGSQLNQIPVGRAAIPGTVGDTQQDASVFPALEPAPMRAVRPTRVKSLLAKLVGNETSRLAMLAGSVLLILVGLLPPSRRCAVLD